MQNIIAKIKKLKEERDAVILVHNYQPGDVQDIADFLGDSLQLAQEAAKTTAKMIVFCGVHFMAETAAIFNPQKIVVMPDKSAGCPMADMIDASKLIALKKQYPQAKVVCYVNTTAAIKAESDICCTSSNAQKIVDSLDTDEIIFVPDKYLGEWVARKSKKNFILYQGFCPTHMRIAAEHITKLKAEHPKAVAMCHPECAVPVKAVCDFVLSTGQMIKLAKENPANEFIVATEEGILHQMKKQNPSKIFYHSSPMAVCPNMKKTDLFKVLDALENPEEHRVVVSAQVAEQARISIEKMLAIK